MVQKILVEIQNQIENMEMEALMNQNQHRDRLREIRQRKISPELAIKIIQGIMIQVRQAIQHLRQLSHEQEIVNSDSYLWTQIDSLEKSIIRAREEKIELNQQVEQLEDQVLSQECVLEMKRDFLQKVEIATRKHRFLLSRGVLSGSTLSSSTPRHYRESVKSIVLP